MDTVRPRVSLYVGEAQLTLRACVLLVSRHSLLFGSSDQVAHYAMALLSPLHRVPGTKKAM